MPLYFAYGANMDVETMAQRCPHSSALGIARMARRRFVIMPSGWANVVPDPARTVHGVLWDLAFSDIPSLDAFEDVDSGLYRKIVQPVLKAGGGSARAMIYTGQGEGGCPQPGYLAAITASARSWNLPQAYIREIEALDADGAARGAGLHAYRTRQSKL